MKNIRLILSRQKTITRALDAALEMTNAIDSQMTTPEDKDIGAVYAEYLRAAADELALYAERLEKRAKPAPVVVAVADRTVN